MEKGCEVGKGLPPHLSSSWHGSPRSSWLAAATPGDRDEDMEVSPSALLTPVQPIAVTTAGNGGTAHSTLPSPMLLPGFPPTCSHWPTGNMPSCLHWPTGNKQSLSQQTLASAFHPLVPSDERYQLEQGGGYICH